GGAVALSWGVVRGAQRGGLGRLLGVADWPRRGVVEQGRLRHARPAVSLRHDGGQSAPGGGARGGGLRASSAPPRRGLVVPYPALEPLRVIGPTPGPAPPTVRVWAEEGGRRRPRQPRRAPGQA